MSVASRLYDRETLQNFWSIRDVDRVRVLVLLAILVTLSAPLQILYHFIDVLGVPVVFLGVIVVSLLAATLLAPVVRPRTAMFVSVCLLLAGLGWYVLQLAGTPSLVPLLTDAFALLTGNSLLQISAVRAWVLGVTPAPVFLTWYFAMRGNYTAAVAVAGATLAFFVLTGDANVVTTSLGVVFGAIALGLGDLERREDSLARAEIILIVVAAMILVPSVISVVPATAGATGPLASQLDGGATMEESLLDTGDELTIQGDVSQSPSVRFVVNSDEPAYWRTGSFDRYTGDGWVRTGNSSPYEEGDWLGQPPGASQTVEQTVTMRAETNVLPAAWQPARMSGVDSAQARSDGSFELDEPLPNGTSYTVTSERPDPSPQDLQNAGTDYPDEIEESYTQLPASTPDRVATRTDRLTANTETPYETARVLERYLENNKNYSLNVDRPRGDVADEFLFEMGAGYCTYYATTMVTMLRTQDIPARFVVGYSQGERVAEDEWVVRGLNSHAWVEVYFPEHGWVEFDPTPAVPREQVEDQNVDEARSNDEPDVDAAGSAEQETAWTPTATPTPAPLTPVPDEPNETGQQLTPPSNVIGGVVTDEGLETESTATPEAVDESDAGLDPRLPTRQQLGLALVALVGSIVGIRRSGVGTRVYRTLWLRYQPRTDPATDVERAFQRLLHHLGQEEYRRRWEDETVREYLDAIDASQEARRVAEIRERARYHGSVDEASADEAVRLVNGLVR